MFPSMVCESTNTGVAPVYSTAFADATNVMLGRTTTAPGLAPSPRSARCRAAVPEESANAPATPTRSAISASNASTCGPRGVTQPERNASRTYCSSMLLTSAFDRKIRDIGLYSCVTTAAKLNMEDLARCAGILALSNAPGAEEQQCQTCEQRHESDHQRAGDAGAGPGQAGSVGPGSHVGSAAAYHRCGPGCSGRADRKHVDREAGGLPAVVSGCDEGGRADLVENDVVAEVAIRVSSVFRVCRRRRPR